MPPVRPRLCSPSVSWMSHTMDASTLWKSYRMKFAFFNGSHFIRWKYWISGHWIIEITSRIAVLTRVNNYCMFEKSIFLTLYFSFLTLNLHIHYCYFSWDLKNYTNPWLKWQIKSHTIQIIQINDQLTVIQRKEKLTIIFFSG